MLSTTEEEAIVAVADVVDALGGGLLRTVVAAPGQTVTDIVIAEPRDRAVDLAGDLVVGAGVADGAEAVELVERAAAAGAAGVVLRRGPARARGVRAAAKRSGVALLELADSASLVHAVGVIQGIVDRAAAPDAALVDPGGEADLLALADAAAVLVDGPVTIEDAQSRVVAYSTRQDVTDTARVSTVLGRRVPAPVVASMRSRGVFRRLARSDEPFLVPPGPALEMPRYVVPVRAGGEWLGSIWAVIDHAPPDDTVAELRRTASVVALHLLRNRALADLTRRLSAERLRALLGGGAVDPSAAAWLPPGPWRVVALGPTGPASGGVEGDLDVWESRFRRSGWRQPLLTDLGEQPYALVAAGTAPDGRPSPGRGPGWPTWRMTPDPVARTCGPGSQAASPPLLLGASPRRLGARLRSRRSGVTTCGWASPRLLKGSGQPSPSPEPWPASPTGPTMRWPDRWPSWPSTTAGDAPHTCRPWRRGSTIRASPPRRREALACMSTRCATGWFG